MHIELNIKNLNETEEAVQEILTYVDAIRKLASQVNWNAVGVEMTIEGDSKEAASRQTTQAVDKGMG